MAVLHQGFPESATAPAVEAVTALLAQGRAHPDTVPGLLEFIGDAATSVTGLDDEEYFAPILPGIAAAVVQAYPVVLSLLESAAPEDAAFVARQAFEMARIPALAGRREELAVLLGRLREVATGPQQAWVRRLAALGVDVRADLAYPDPAVRLRAALAYAPEPAARQIILKALRDPSPPGIHPSEVVAAAIQVAGNFAEIADAACAVVARATWPGADDEWGQLVRYAFAGRREPELTAVQRALVRALVANPDLWHKMNGNVGAVYRDAGLPFDRAACRRLAG